MLFATAEEATESRSETVEKEDAVLIGDDHDEPIAALAPNGDFGQEAGDEEVFNPDEWTLGAPSKKDKKRKK